MDASKMTFSDESFDAVFDKGTLDALYTGKVDLVVPVVKEVFRVLRPGGIFVSVSFGQPKDRQDVTPCTRPTCAVPSAEVGGITWQDYRTAILKKDQLSALYMYSMVKPLS